MVISLNSQAKKDTAIKDLKNGNGKRFAIVIGINHYEESEDIPSLKKAVNDAKGITEILKKEGQFESVFLLTDEEKKDFYPRKNNIITRVDYLMNFVKPEDLVLIFFSGHGITNKENGKGYLIPVDAKPKDIFKSSVSIDDDIVKKLKQKKIKKTILMFDACRNQISEGKKSIGNIDGLISKIFTNAELSATFFSTREGLFSYEDPESKYGVYTRYLLDGIKGQADNPEFGGNRDGIVTFDELENFVQSSVQDWSTRNNKKQIPFTKLYGESFGQIAISMYYDPLIDPIKMIKNLKRVTNTIDMEFVQIPAGEFIMGCTDNDSSCEKEAKPAHKVIISKPFFIGKNEVTQGQWNKIMDSNPSDFKKCGENCPVENVTWERAQEFIKKLNEKEKTQKYRLPTEAEWEYAAKSQTKTKYYWGDVVNADYLWYWDNSEKTTHPVGEKKPNAYGLFDMSGNVWEWVEDYYDETFYSSSPTTDPINKKESPYRSLRGGSYYNYANKMKPSWRSYNSPSTVKSYYGLRIAFTEQ